MSSSGLSLSDHLSRQLLRLCRLCGVADTGSALSMLTNLLGPAGPRPLSEPPLWPSDVSDDHSPVEFSLALDQGRRPTLRLLAETLAAEPGPLSNRQAALGLLDWWATRYRPHLGRFDQVRDLFVPGTAGAGRFSLWYSLVFGPSGPPAIKVYFNPTVGGVDGAGERVAEALHRLGYGAVVPALLHYGTRAGRLDAVDWPIFFALDLHDGPDARVKVYLAHEHATAATAARAARVAGIDGTQIETFCRLAGGIDRFHLRPLISAVTFRGVAAAPRGYSLYLPIRAYVDDDQQAWDRVQKVAARYGHDPAPIGAAIAALTDRDLDAGVGLIAHVALRLAHGDAAGITTYLSSEAYAVTAARRQTAPTTTHQHHTITTS